MKRESDALMNQGIKVDEAMNDRMLERVYSFELISISFQIPISGDLI